MTNNIPFNPHAKIEYVLYIHNMCVSFSHNNIYMWIVYKLNNVFITSEEEIASSNFGKVQLPSKTLIPELLKNDKIHVNLSSF